MRPSGPRCSSRIGLGTLCIQQHSAKPVVAKFETRRASRFKASLQDEWPEEAKDEIADCVDRDAGMMPLETKRPLRVRPE